MTLLRYVGQQPCSFMVLPYLGMVEPGEFEARESDVESLLARADVELADPAEESDGEPAAEPEPVPAGPAKPRKAPTPKPGAVPTAE